jgi:hypothetical protein
MAGALRKLLALSLAEHALLLQAAIALPLTRRSLRVHGYAATLRTLERGARRPARLRLAGSDGERAAAAARLVHAAAARRPSRANCLPRSLVLRMLLLRQGLRPELRIGVRLVDGRLEGHAWVEHAGVPLAQHPDVATHFAPFPGDLATITAWDA